MEFCPTCGNMLQYELPHLSRPARLFCPTCPYVYNLDHKAKIKRKQRLVKKETDPEMPPDDLMAGPQTQERCPNCDNNKAWFSQAQIRSADEPMTTIYKCTECHFGWRDDN